MLRQTFERAVARLPAQVHAGDLTMTMQDRPEAVRVVGDLYALRFPYTWRLRRRTGTGHVELIRCGSVLTQATVTLSGLPGAVAAGAADTIRHGSDLPATGATTPDRGRIVPLFG